jgi:hypothetical protein
MGLIPSTHIGARLGSIRLHHFHLLRNGIGAGTEKQLRGRANKAHHPGPPGRLGTLEALERGQHPQLHVQLQGSLGSTGRRESSNGDATRSDMAQFALRSGVHPRATGIEPLMPTASKQGPPNNGKLLQAVQSRARLRCESAAPARDERAYQASRECLLLREAIGLSSAGQMRASRKQ